jgi:putative flippase GtrA
LNQFAFFVIAGGIAALVNFGSRIALSQFFGYAFAIVLAYILGMITAFALNRALVFPEGNERLHKQAGWFVAINILALAQTLAISLLLSAKLLPAIGWHWHPETIAHAVGVAFPIVSSYFGHKHLSFKRSE